MTIVAEVVHALPGRVRLRVPALRRDPGLAERIIAAGMAHAGVRSVRVNLACASVVVEGEPADGLLFPVLVQQWATASAPPVGPAAPSPAVWRRWAPVGLSAAGLVLSLLGSPGLAGVLTGLSAIPIFIRAVQALVAERRASVDSLDAAAVAMMLVLADVRSAALMCALVSVGEEIRERTARRSRRAVLDLHEALGRSAWLVRGTERVRIPVDQIRRGDTVVVYTGDLIPVDGVVVDGTATVDQKMLTGESAPVFRCVGDRVLAATAVADGKLYVVAQATGEATRAGLVVQALSTAPVFDTRAASYANQFADRLVIPTIALAAVSWAITGSLARAASILILDFATGLRVSAPTAVLATMTRAAHRDVLIKSGRSIEQLAKVNAIIFDKTGTLTRGKPRVSRVVSLDAGREPDELLALAAAAELRLHHPSARALIRHARRRKVAIPEREMSQYTPGRGVVAQVAGQEVRVGSRRFLEEQHVDLCSADTALGALIGEGQSCVYVAVGGDLAGLIAYHDPPRRQAARAIARLRALGVTEIYMVTGDDPAAAEPVGRALGVDHVLASVMPDDKAAVVIDLQRRGYTVAVIGDGINDSPALACADVSISLRNGADVARATADVVLMRPGKLQRIPEAIELSRRCLAIIHQNLAIVAMPNAGALALASTVGLSPVMSTVLNNGSTLVAALNSLRPVLQPGPFRRRAA